MRFERRRWTSARFEGGLDQRHRGPGVLHRSDQIRVLACVKALQVRHPANESIGEPRASQGNFGPFRLAPGSNTQFVRFAARIVEEKTKLGVRRALGSVETK